MHDGTPELPGERPISRRRAVRLHAVDTGDGPLVPLGTTFSSTPPRR